ncbi:MULTISPECIES: hypothetical protein [unclassified Sphingobacterium]|uniref:hypothetical protein n=1 Tax=unclassified Sphingobacterium TaxID=2609468 RepID=UPI0019D2F79D|nr:hypothetical protein [Sphingobacterium sp. B16(2022)]
MNSNRAILSFLMLIFCFCEINAQNKLSDKFNQVSPLTSAYVYPTRIIWKEGNVIHATNLLKRGNGQANLYNPNTVVFKNENNQIGTSILLDFGIQMNASIEIITGMWGGQ